MSEHPQSQQYKDMAAQFASCPDAASFAGPTLGDAQREELLQYPENDYFGTPPHPKEYVAAWGDSDAQIEMSQAITNGDQTIKDGNRIIHMGLNDFPHTPPAQTAYTPSSWFDSDWQKRPGENRAAYRKRVGSKTRYVKGRDVLHPTVK